MVLRLTTKQDLPELREVAISSYRDAFAAFNTPENMQAYIDSAYSMPALEKELDEPESYQLLAVEEEKIVGFVRLRKSDEVRELLGTNTIELQRLYVLTSAHGKSVGSKLLEAAMKHAIGMKYEWIWLGVWERNFKAQAFYKKWGFEKFSEHIFWMGDDPQIDWLFKKKL
jgi:ribosomal protein S18 acetylase RimI-like enzyme